MKKRIFSVLLVLALCMGILPMAGFAAPTMLDHVDITIELPQGGDLFDYGFVPGITSFTGGGVDLLATGAGILNTNWVGDVVVDDDGTPHFRAGTTYNVSIKLALNTAAGYCAKYVMSNGEYLVGPDTFSATVNGVPATIVRNNPPYFPTVEVSLKLEGEVLSEEEKVEITEEDIMRKEVRREIKASRTWAESSEFDKTIYPEKVLVMDAVTDFGGNGSLAEQEEALRDTHLTTVIFDSDYAAQASYLIPDKSSMREVWVGDGVDILKFYHTFTVEADPVETSQTPFNRSDGTLFISESAASVLKEEIGSAWYPTPAFKIKVYSGTDVYAAQKAGASAATKEFCTNHKYTEQIRAIDRVYTFPDCKTEELYYYSCEYCGKCEYNPNHVNYDLTMTKEELENYKNTFGLNGQYNTELPNDSAYIGVNAAGQHVWWLSCHTCGTSYKYDTMNMTEKNQFAAGMNGMSFEEYKASMLAGLKKYEEQVLNSTDIMPNTFTLSRKSNAHMSEWAQSDVNFALNDNLIDDSVLGSDYTQNISRLQFCSVAVRLAEELTGKSITPADSNTFSDTNDAYVLKAYAAGIAAGTSDTTFSPNGTLTRQQMGAFLYRALRYIENNSDYKYTSYNSKLSDYTDSWSVQSWAEEAMAFMNAIELIKGTTDTTLDPDGLCTIEQAVAVADRCVYAHQLGWYQVEPYKYRYDYDGTWHGDSSTKVSTCCRFDTGKYVWVTGRRFNLNYSFDFAGNSVEEGQLPFYNTYTGQIMSIDYKDVIPVRD